MSEANTIKNFFMYKDCVLEDLGEGVSRKVLSYSDNLMVVEVHFEKGAIGQMHTHPHEQCTYIVEGVFEFNVDGEKVVLRAGDTTYKQPDVPHGAVCLESGKLLDIFTPMRKEFVD